MKRLGPPRSAEDLSRDQCLELLAEGQKRVSEYLHALMCLDPIHHRASHLASRAAGLPSPVDAPTMELVFQFRRRIEKQYRDELAVELRKFLEKLERP